LASLNVLHFALMGAWYPVLGAFMLGRGFSAADVGWAYALLPLASVVVPFVAGQIVDRWLPAQLFLAGTHLLGGLALLRAAVAFDQFDRAGLLLTLLAWAVLYGAAQSPVTALCFRHLRSPESDFGKVRVGGTFGWMVVGWALTLWLSAAPPDPAAAVADDGTFAWLERLGAQMAVDPVPSDCLRIGGWLSVLTGVFCLVLPHTPPLHRGGRPWAFLDALVLLREWRFAAFLAISLLLSTSMIFNLAFAASFLIDLGVTAARVPMVLTLSQLSEVFAMPLLGWFLIRLGLRRTLLLGMTAWVVRYALYAIGGPVWLMTAALALNGVGFVWYLIAASAHVDRIAPRDVRASAQSLLQFVLYGVGMFLGAQLAGYIKDRFVIDAATDWQAVFTVPTAIAAVCLVALLATFRDASVPHPSQTAAKDGAPAQ